MGKVHSKLYWILQVAGWFGLAGLIYWVNRFNNANIDFYRILSLLVFAITGLIVSHGIRFIFLRFHVLSKKPGPIFFWILGASMLAGLIFKVVYSGFQLILIDSYFLESGARLLGEWLVNVLIFSVWSVIYFLNYYFLALRRNELNNLKLIARQQEMELALMRSQLNPHFLFNSLNSIRALISENPSLAKVGVSKLSNLLRSILIYSRREQVTIQEEMDFVRDYIDLEKIRFEERLSYEEIIQAELSQIMIPPMTIQSLVENSVKHGINALKQGGTVVVEIEKKNEMLMIRVSNDGQISHKTDTGVGLINTQQRLKRSFKMDIDLMLSESNNRVYATINIPLTPAQS